jgi:hypothetical protein
MYFKALALGFVCFFSACSFAPPKPPLTQLQIREMQTRSYENKKSNFKQIMKAMINVLQDDGFIIKNADKELGFVTAEKEVDLGTGWGSVFAGSFHGQQARYSKNTITACSANITEVGSQVKVRAVFQNKTMDNFGAVSSVYQINDLKYYQDFFTKVDKSLYLESQGF